MIEVLITSSVLILALALMRKLWKGRISPVFQYALWFIVAVRLLVPVPVFGNVLSIMNVVEYVADGTEKWAEGLEKEIRTDETGKENDARAEGSARIEEGNPADLHLNNRAVSETL